MTDLADLVKTYKAAQRAYIDAETRVNLSISALSVAQLRYNNAMVNLDCAGKELRAAGRALEEAGLSNSDELSKALALARSN